MKWQLARRNKPQNFEIVLLQAKVDGHWRIKTGIWDGSRWYVDPFSWRDDWWDRPPVRVYRWAAIDKPPSVPQFSPKARLARAEKALEDAAVREHSRRVAAGVSDELYFDPETRSLIAH